MGFLTIKPNHQFTTGIGSTEFQEKFLRGNFYFVGPPSKIDRAAVARDRRCATDNFLSSASPGPQKGAKRDGSGPFSLGDRPLLVFQLFKPNLHFGFFPLVPDIEPRKSVPEIVRQKPAEVLGIVCVLAQKDRVTLEREQGFNHYPGFAFCRTDMGFNRQTENR
jgi:hypothetical protein